MGFQYLWPLGLLILIPVIIIMYLLRQKTEPHPFSSLFLWRETYRNLHSDTPWEKLKKSLLMVMQIITVIALIIALMSPYIRSHTGNANHVIIVIDNSASMKTKYDVSSTRLDQAKEAAVSYVEKLRSGTGISILTSSKDATLLLSDSADKSLAIKRIKDIQATNYSGSCDAATGMARSMSGQWTSCELIYFTDSAVTNGFENAGGYIMDVYSDVGNAIVEYVGHGKNADGTLTFLAKITNNTAQTLNCEVNLYGDGKIIDVSPALNIEAGKSDIIYFEKVNFTGNTVCVELNNFKDALDEDNRAYDVVTAIKECNTLLMTSRNLYLEKAIGLVNGVSVIKSDDVSSFATLTANTKYDLYIFDGMLPDALPETGNIILINAFDSSLCTVTETLDGATVDTEDSKLTGYLSNFSFGVSKVTAFDCPYWAEKFLTVSRNSTTYTVGCYGNYEGRTICIIGFDFHNSDLPLKMEFPILIYNIMSECAGTGILQSTVVNTGSSVQISGGGSDSTTSVSSPSGKKTDISGLVTAFSDTSEIGAYTVKRTVNGESTEETFVANFPKNESVIASPASSSVGGSEVIKSETATSTLNLRNIFIIIILGLLVVEWIVFIRGL